MVASSSSIVLARQHRIPRVVAQPIVIVMALAAQRKSKYALR